MSCSSAICSNAIPADQVKLDVYSPLHVGLGLFPGVLRRRWLSAQRWTKCCEPHNVRGPPASAACAIPTRFLVFGQFCWFCCSIIPKWSKKNTVWNHLALASLDGPFFGGISILLSSNQLQLDIRFTWSLYVSSTNMLLGLWLWNLEPGTPFEDRFLSFANGLWSKDEPQGASQFLTNDESTNCLPWSVNCAQSLLGLDSII